MSILEHTSDYFLKADSHKWNSRVKSYKIFKSCMQRPPERSRLLQAPWKWTRWSTSLYSWEFHQSFRAPLCTPYLWLLHFSLVFKYVSHKVPKRSSSLVIPTTKIFSMLLSEVSFHITNLVTSLIKNLGSSSVSVGYMAAHKALPSLSQPPFSALLTTHF